MDHASDATNEEGRVHLGPKILGQHLLGVVERQAGAHEGMKESLLAACKLLWEQIPTSLEHDPK